MNKRVKCKTKTFFETRRKKKNRAKYFTGLERRKIFSQEKKKENINKFDYLKKKKGKQKSMRKYLQNMSVGIGLEM